MTEQASPDFAAMAREAVGLDKPGPSDGGAYIVPMPSHLAVARYAFAQGRESRDAEVADLQLGSDPRALAILRQSYVTLAFAFRRLHGSARSRDRELCADFAKVRGHIEAYFKEIGVKL